MATSDYAILVGISRYADSHLHPLAGPLGDVRLIRDWLTSPEKCDVPAQNITTLVSDESSSDPPATEDMPPVFQDFLSAFLSLVRKPDKTGFIQRQGGRLYLYFSGHGFCEKHRREAHAAVYAANADRDVNWNIYGTYFAQWTKDQGLFDEIVLIMDCCRDAELAKLPLTPPLRKPTDLGVANEVKLFEVYAAPRGGKAQERPIASRQGEVHGFLTHAFLDALDHADPGSPTVSSAALKGYLEERWSALCGAEPTDPPEIIVPSNGEILFRRGAASDLPQRFRLSELKAGDAFEIVGDGLLTVARVEIGPSEVRIERTGGNTTSQPISEGVFVVPLPGSLYMAVASTQSGVLRRRFQAGDSDVEL